LRHALADYGDTHRRSSAHRTPSRSLTVHTHTYLTRHILLAGKTNRGRIPVGKII
jgi:hypothetical protein